MTTDLTGDFGLDEEEFDWDDFLPDPDDADIAALVGTREDDDDPALDDSDLDWEAALRDEPDPEGDGRAGAAYERIVDTVRRSFEEPEEAARAVPESHSIPESWTEPADLDDDAELDLGAEFEPELPEPALLLDPEPELESELLLEPEPDLEAELLLEPEPDLGPELLLEPEPEQEPDLGPELLLEPEPEPEQELGPELLLEPEPETEYVDVLHAELWVPTRRPDEDWSRDVEPEPDSRPDPDPPWGTERLLAADVPPEPGAEPEGDPGSDDYGASPDGPAHARTRKNRGAKERSRAFTVTFVLACLVLVVLAATLVVQSLHHTPPAITSPPARSAVPATASAAAARIETATHDVDSATAEVRAGIAAMTNFPTPASVATIIDPYISSLQLYEAVMAASKVPASAASEAANAEAEARRDLAFLETIHGLPPVQLGAFLGQVGAETTQLQATLSGLEQSLPG
jgi:hypothetical protein